MSSILSNTVAYPFCSTVGSRRNFGLDDNLLAVSVKKVTERSQLDYCNCLQFCPSGAYDVVTMLVSGDLLLAVAPSSFCLMMGGRRKKTLELEKPIGMRLIIFEHHL